jgi:hypothetical protein
MCDILLESQTLTKIAVLLGERLYMTRRIRYADSRCPRDNSRIVGKPHLTPPELEPDIVLTQLHASGVDEILHTL